MSKYDFKSQGYNPDSFTVKLRGDDTFRLEQSLTPYLEHAELQRKLDADNPRTTRNFRSFAIIPDIVAIDILTKYGINIHAPEFMSDDAQKKRFRQIVMTEYPKLMTSNIKKA